MHLSRAEVAACGALLEYLELTQKEALPTLEFPQAQESAKFYADRLLNTKKFGVNPINASPNPKFVEGD